MPLEGVFEEPITFRWVIFACGQESWVPGVHSLSSPDFPEYGYRFFQIYAILAYIAGVSLHYYLYQNPLSKSSLVAKLHLDIRRDRLHN